MDTKPGFTIKEAELVTLLQVLRRTVNSGNLALPDDVKGFLSGLIPLAELAERGLLKTVTAKPVTLVSQEDLESVAALAAKYEQELSSLSNPRKALAELVERAKQQLTSAGADVWRKRLAELDVKEKAINQREFSVRSAETALSSRQTAFNDLKSKEEATLAKTKNSLDEQRAALNRDRADLERLRKELETRSAQVIEREKSANDALHQAQTIQSRYSGAEKRLADQAEELKALQQELCQRHDDLEVLMAMAGEDLYKVLSKAESLVA